jgi:hypothetical protein
VEQSAIANKIDEVEKFYRMKEAGEIKEFLASYPELADLLLEAYPHIEKQFGRGAVVELRFPRDSEHDRERDLLAMIQNSLDTKAAIASWHRLWDEWWCDASARPGAWRLTIEDEPTGDVEE